MRCSICGRTPNEECCEKCHEQQQRAEAAWQLDGAGGHTRTTPPCVCGHAIGNHNDQSGPCRRVRCACLKVEVA